MEYKLKQESDFSTDEKKSCSYLRIFIYVTAVLNLTTQYFYFTVTLPIYTNEITVVRNLPETVAGAGFGALCLSLAVTLILAPKISTCLSIRQTILISLLLAIPSTPLFYFELPTNTYIIYSFLSRLLQGISIGLCDVRYLDMMSTVFPDKTTLNTSFYQLSYTFSLIVGPVAGGILYQNYGFWVPVNAVTAAVTLSSLLGLVCTYYLPQRGESISGPEQLPQIRDLFHINILIVCSVMIAASTSLAVMESFFGNYMLNTFGKSESFSGMVMAVDSAVYAVSISIGGAIGSNREEFKLDKEADCYLSAVLYCVNGCGNGLIEVAVLPIMISLYKNHQQVPENVASCHMGGLYSSAYFLGSAVGPLLGGWVIKLASYKMCCTAAGVYLLLELFLLYGQSIRSEELLNPRSKEAGNKEPA